MLFRNIWNREYLCWYFAMKNLNYYYELQIFNLILLSLYLFVKLLHQEALVKVTFVAFTILNNVRNSEKKKLLLKQRLDIDVEKF